NCASGRAMGCDVVWHRAVRSVSQTRTGAPIIGMTTPLGLVVATERRPNTPHTFHFWTAINASVGIGTIVRVETDIPIDGQIPVIYGVVTDAEAWTDLQSALHD